jgi:hypothetical protein
VPKAKQAEPNEPYISFGKDIPTQPLPGSAEELMRQGWVLKTKIDALTADLKCINKQLTAKYQECSLVIPELCRCPISTSVRVSLDDKKENVEGLRTLFGDMFNTYVKRAVVYSPTKALSDICKDPSHKLYAKVSRFLDVKWSEYSIKWNTPK